MDRHSVAVPSQYRQEEEPFSVFSALTSGIAISPEHAQFDISHVVSQLIEGSPETAPLSIEFHELAFNSDPRSDFCRPLVFHELLTINQHLLRTIQIDAPMSKELRFVIAHSDIAPLYPHDRMTSQEDNEWAFVLSQHLNLLSLSKRWDFEHSEHLNYTVAMSEGILCPVKSQLPQERIASMDNAVHSLLTSAPSLLLRDTNIDANINAARNLLRFATLWANSNFSDELEALFDFVNQKCRWAYPESYGPAIDFLEEEEPEEDGELLDERDRYFDPTDETLPNQDRNWHETYEAWQDERYKSDKHMDSPPPDSPLFYDEHEISGEPFTPLEHLHREILLACRKIGQGEELENFLVNALHANNHRMPDWGDALDSLACIAPFRIRQVLPHLIKLAFHDTDAVIYLLSMMNADKRLESECSVDLSSDVVNGMRRIKRSDQTAIIEGGKELFYADAEVVPEANEAMQQLIKLAERLHHPISTRKCDL